MTQIFTRRDYRVEIHRQKDDHGRDSAVGTAKSKPSGEHKSVETMISDLNLPALWESKHVLFKSPFIVYAVFTWQLYSTNIPSAPGC